MTTQQARPTVGVGARAVGRSASRSTTDAGAGSAPAFYRGFSLFLARGETGDYPEAVRVLLGSGSDRSAISAGAE